VSLVCLVVNNKFSFILLFLPFHVMSFFNGVVWVLLRDSKNHRSQVFGSLVMMGFDTVWLIFILQGFIEPLDLCTYHFH
jgi:hypothetical protein